MEWGKKEYNLTALGEKRSHPPTLTTAVTLNAAAERTSVPALPGSAIESRIRIVTFRSFKAKGKIEEEEKGRWKMATTP